MIGQNPAEKKGSTEPLSLKSPPNSTSEAIVKPKFDACADTPSMPDGSCSGGTVANGPVEFDHAITYVCLPCLTCNTFRNRRSGNDDKEAFCT